MVSTHLCMGKVKGTVVVVMMSYDITVWLDDVI